MPLGRMSLEQGDILLSPGETSTQLSRMLLLCSLINSTEGGVKMGKELSFPSPKEKRAISGAWQRDGCTGCSSIRDPQSDYKDTKDLSALKKDKRDAGRFTLHPSFPHRTDRGLFAQGLQLVNFEQGFVLLLFPILCDTP